MPAGQLLEGIQKVSTVDAPGRRVLLYHWSLAQEQETALERKSDVSFRFIVSGLPIIWRETERGRAHH
jgi:hypothetical protein